MLLTQTSERLSRIGETGVPEAIDGVLRAGVDAGASDIHLEPTAHHLVVRMRIDGVLREVGALPGGLRANLTARLKVLADLLTYRSDLPQEGRIPRERIGLTADVRVSTFPTLYGEKVVIRVFDPGRCHRTLDDLALPTAGRDLVESALRRPGGVILLTGPSGSGKTTLIYALLRRLLDFAQGGRNIVTVEDPVEQAIPGVSQSQINPGSGLTFAVSLRSLLRQDPEVIMVGEVRDRETARIAVEAGLTGHLVITTLHSGSAAGAFTRLHEMEVEPYLLTSAIALVTAQRLVRVLCPRCRTRAPLSDATGVWADLAGQDAFRANGCADCAGVGYTGRSLLAEFLAVDEPVRAAIRRRADTTTIEQTAIASGMIPLATAARGLLARGVTDLTELLRVL